VFSDKSPQALDDPAEESGLKPAGSAFFSKIRRQVGIRDEWLTRPANKTTWVLPKAFMDSLDPGDAGPSPEETARSDEEP